MPYLRDTDKDVMNEQPIGTAFFDPEQRSPGKLTYAIYRMLQNYGLAERGFATFAVVIGALVCAGLEFYRRHVAPYEEQKIAMNGDVL